MNKLKKVFKHSYLISILFQHDDFFIMDNKDSPLR